LQCVAVCVAMWCRVLQCVAGGSALERARVLQCVAVCCSVCCGVLQCVAGGVAVCCGVLRCDAVCC